MRPLPTNITESCENYRLPAARIRIRPADKFCDWGRYLPTKRLSREDCLLVHCQWLLWLFCYELHHFITLTILSVEISLIVSNTTVIHTPMNEIFLWITQQISRYQIHVLNSYCTYHQRLCDGKSIIILYFRKNVSYSTLRLRKTR